MNVRRAVCLAVLAAVVSGGPAERQDAYQDCPELAYVDTLPAAELGELVSCLDRFGWSHD